MDADYSPLHRDSCLEPVISSSVGCTPKYEDDMDVGYSRPHLLARKPGCPCKQSMAYL